MSYFQNNDNTENDRSQPQPGQDQFSSNDNTSPGSYGHSSSNAGSDTYGSKTSSGAGYGQDSNTTSGGYGQSTHRPSDQGGFSSSNTDTSNTGGYGSSVTGGTGGYGDSGTEGHVSTGESGASNRSDTGADKGEYDAYDRPDTTTISRGDHAIQGGTYGSGGDTFQSDEHGSHSKPGISDRVKGGAEKLAGKMTGNTGLVEKGQERKTGDYDGSGSTY